ncbi:hypothetical protein MMC25_006358 [Agyrium rufum]|nr:hypothetical protein [Agyrium rufum]
MAGDSRKRKRTATDNVRQRSDIGAHFIEAADQVFDPDGDVFLELQRDKPGLYVLQVSSKILSLASPVFAAMFRPGFKEGDALKRDGSCRVALLEDGHIAMKTLCAILHFRQREIPDLGEMKSDTKHLNELSTLADKYGCTDALSCWVAERLSRHFALLHTIYPNSRPEEHSSVYAAFLYTAYTFQLARHFTIITQAMIWSDTKDLKSQLPRYREFGLDEAIAGQLPNGLLEGFLKIEKSRRLAVVKKIESLIESIAMIELGDGTLETMILHLRKELLWPLTSAYRDLSCRDITTRLETLRDLRISTEAEGARSWDPTDAEGAGTWDPTQAGRRERQ